MKEKKYKNIKDVSKLLDIKTHVIRYWDSKFEGISTRMNTNKQRFFNAENIKKIQELKNTLYHEGKHIYSLDLAKKIIDKKNKDKPPNKAKSLSIKNKDFNISISNLVNIRNNLKKILDL